MTETSQTTTEPLVPELRQPAAGPPVCAHCGTDNVRASASRRGADLMHLGRIAYRCRVCRGRFYVKPPPDSNGAGPKARRKRSDRTREPFWLRPHVRRRISELTIVGLAILVFGLFLYLLAHTGA